MKTPDGSVALLNFNTPTTALAHAMSDGRPICRNGRWLGCAIPVCGAVTCRACLKSLQIARRRFLEAASCNDLAGPMRRAILPKPAQKRRRDSEKSCIYFVLR
jgi:hypothetical protein